LSERITVDIVGRLRALFPTLDLQVQQERGFDRVVLPSAAKSDFAFELIFDDDQKAALDARLKGESAKAYFWYRPFEQPDYDTYELRASEIVATVELVLRSRSRVTQTKGLLFWRFNAEVESAGEWRPLYAHLALKGQFDVPSISGRSKEYHADAVVCAASSVV
jgi:hypothetical protein